ncbi:Phosphatidate cytidylyltransferase, photoreceptor-specific [Clonorchis sinensis]|uniref:Phosphatidate cytidylyltransferase n=1 Tax=Clonorchis sinensis TaxID=79923 RepID=A0A419PX42_CLOSI|nr:Phosphatidate cytidylyltransferase, photoreceptor-specific [Clonorchis sinensis]
MDVGITRRHQPTCETSPESDPSSGDVLLSQSKSVNRDEEEDEDMATDPINPDFVAAEKLHQGTSCVPSFITSLVGRLPPRWMNWTVRFFTTIFLISTFSALVYLGPLALVCLVLLLQFACFYEIINIGLVVYRSHDLPWFRLLSWYFLFSSNYFLFGESLITRFRLLLAKEDFLQPLVTHHHFLSYSFYSSGIVLFVLSLVKRHYIKQFTLFGWTHVTLLLVVCSSHFQIQNIFNGIIWFLMPVALVICNDIMAYVFGFFFGKTPLIKLSPKKTWEGFIGGGLATILFGFFFSLILLRYDYFVCPLEWDDTIGALTTSCTRNPVFIPRTYNVSKWLFMVPFRQFTWYPFLWHYLIIALYVSVVGPFGGFFASGFKRAFRIKDFGDVFPGHGGVVDRFDCQFIVGVFVFIYYNSFVRIYSPASLLSRIYVLPIHEQLAFYRLLTEGLYQRGLLPDRLSNLVNELIDPSELSSVSAISEAP